MRKIILAFFCLAAFGGFFSRVAVAQTNDSVSFELTSSCHLITKNIDKNLILRITKDSSVTQKNFGWLVEVVRRPASPNSRNLIYANRLGVGADPSQVMAWQVSGQDVNFPANRHLNVRGTPYTIDIALLDAQAEGLASDAKFTSGKLRISWHRR